VSSFLTAHQHNKAIQCHSRENADFFHTSQLQQINKPTAQATVDTNNVIT